MRSHRTDTLASMIISEEVWAPRYCAAYISNVDWGGCTYETDAVLLLWDRIWEKRSRQLFPSHAKKKPEGHKEHFVLAFTCLLSCVFRLCLLFDYAPSWPDASPRCSLYVKNVVKRNKSDGATIIVSAPWILWFKGAYNNVHITELMFKLCYMGVLLSVKRNWKKTKTFLKKYLKVE